MPYTLEQLQALRDALATGVRRVRFGDRELEFQDPQQLQKLIVSVEAELAQSKGTPIARQIRVSTQKGF
jgi:hypothetical protein